jgi:hypothetical protein
MPGDVSDDGLVSITQPKTQQSLPSIVSSVGDINIRSVSYSTTNAKSLLDRWPASDADDEETMEPNPPNRSPPKPPAPISEFTLYKKRLYQYRFEEGGKDKLEPKHATTDTTKRALGDDEGGYLEDGDLEGDDSAESSRDFNLETDADRIEGALYYNVLR